MILRMGSNASTNRKRLSANGIQIVGDVGYDYAGFKFRSGVLINVTKNALSIDINPQVFDIIGGKVIHYPTWIHPGETWDGTLTICGIKGLSEDQDSKLDALTWVFRARLHIVGMPV